MESSRSRRVEGVSILNLTFKIVISLVVAMGFTFLSVLLLNFLGNKLIFENYCTISYGFREAEVSCVPGSDKYVLASSLIIKGLALVSFFFWYFVVRRLIDRILGRYA